MTTAEVVSLARHVLQDVAGVRWTDPEMVEWINAAVREIANLSTKATSMVLNVPLVSGTMQDVSSLPGGLKGIIFQDAICNTGLSGNRPGSPINEIKRASLDALIPDWHSDTSSLDSIYYTKDPMTPTVYFLYPPRPEASAGYARIVVTVAPNPVTSISADEIVPLNDRFTNSVVDYVLFRCFSENVALPNSQARAQLHISAFTASLKGVEFSGEKQAPVQTQPQPAQGAQQ